MAIGSILQIHPFDFKPSAPPSGQFIIYVKTDNTIYIQDSSGVEYAFGSTSAISQLSGEATAMGPGNAVVTLSNSAVIGKVLTGFTPGPNSTVLAADTILEAIEKLQAQITGVAGTTLAGDVTGTLSATVVSFVGGKTAAQVATSVNDTLAATSANTASTIVKRDAGGNISVTQINGVAPEAHASRHLPSGADPLATAAPTTNLDSTTSNAAGSANSFSRSDHTHAITTATPVTQNPDQSNSAGSAAGLAKADHVHNIPTAAPSANLTATTTNAQGTSTSFARADHSHAITTGAPSTQNPDQANAAGTSSDLARADHIHNIPADAPTTNLSPATTNAEGTGTSFARNDHTHAIDTSLVGDITTIEPDDTASAGTVDKFARGDHRHAIAADVPVATGAANAEGVSTSFARADHVHNVVTSSGILNTAGTLSPDYAAPVTQTPDQSNATGTSNKVAMSDHVHNIPADAPTTTLSPATTNDEGTGTSFARNDHTHAIATALTADITTIQPDDSASAGTADNYARGDHKHAIVAATASTITPDQSNAEGSSTSFARADHIHNIPSGTPVQIGTSNFPGAAASFALSDHVHAHGNQTSGTLHAAATTSVNGFMSSADKTKLDDATSSNTPSTLVIRDASGNFSSAAVSVSSSVFRDATTNTITVSAPSSVTTYSLTLPSAQGGTNTVLQNNGSGVLSWTTPTVTGSALTSAKIWVGDGSNLAVERSPSGDVTMSNLGAFTVATVGGKTASAIATSVDDTQAATDLDTASTIVKRDASKNTRINALLEDVSGNIIWDLQNRRLLDTNGKYQIDASTTLQTISLIPNSDAIGQLHKSVSGGSAQFLIQNTATGGASSTDFIANADNGVDSNNYADFGINSSTFSDAGWTINGAGDAYVYNNDANLAIGTASAQPLLFFTGGTLAANERARFNGGQGFQLKTSSIDAVIALTDAATIATDASLGNIFTVTLGGNRTLGAPTNPVDGQKITYRIRQDATGSRTLSYNAVFNFPPSLAGLSLSTSPNTFDYLGCQYNGVTSKWDVLAFTSGLS